MALRSFQGSDLDTLGDALDIAEDVTGNYYKFSHRQWRRYRYDVRTLPLLSCQEISEGVFALLNKGFVVKDEGDPIPRTVDHYSICVQDHQVLEAVSRDADISLLPLMIYVFTHELVHIVRFSNFLQRFDLPWFKREEEEKAVHNITHEILRKVAIPRLGHVLSAYRGHRTCRLSGLC
ncbi:conserved hypothetical protein [uncultured Desulfatiglans sp.]|uniref:Uncharacterized protein n=1 Tax=Uncultured Desulfatiglans sp. TaxID=1748965 RepID=A0A653A148_UNCDX|nr:conserved hypothetical protein [uncultured Desulfatiglans sp.]